MSETKALLGLLMLALVFNITMIGIFDFVNTQGLDKVNCNVDPSLEYNESYAGAPEGMSHCEPEGLPWWYYLIWAIIDGVLIYAFVPFIK